MAPKKKYTRRTFVAGIGSALVLSTAPRVLAQTSPCAVGSYHAQYYRGVNFDVLAKSRCEASPLNKNWGAGRISPLIRADNASARWTGLFQFAAGEHEFTATADDGIRVWVNGVLIIDGWRDQPPTIYKVRHTLSAGTHEVKVEYYERAGIAVCKLSWALVGTTTEPPALPSHPATNADKFVDSIGINTHLSYLDSATYGNFPWIKAKLLELGIRYIRDAGNIIEPGWNSVVFGRHQELAEAGIKTNYIIFRNQYMHPITSAKIQAIKNYAPDSIETFEGPNEYNLSNGGEPNWDQNLRDFQRALYQAVKGNPSTANVPVLAPAMENLWATVGDISAYCDYGNHHMYPGGRDPESPGGNIAPQDGEYGSYTWYKNQAELMSKNKPLITTETGYHNKFEPFNGHPAVPEDVDAVYLPRIYAYYFLRGSGRTHVYELVNAFQPTANNHTEDFGLVRNDRTEKPAFPAIRNLITLLEDPGNQSFIPGSLSYALAGNLADVKTLLLQKANGRFYLLVWLAKRIYDPFQKVYEPVTPRSLSLNLGGQASAVNVYEPNAGTSSIATHSNVSSVPVTVTDKIRILEIV